MRLSEFIADVHSSLQSYSDSGDIDDLSIKTYVINELRKFGNDITQTNEIVLDIENSKAILPDNFKSLRLALKVDPVGCNIRGDRKSIEDAYIIRKRIENPAYFNEVTHEYITSCHSKIITESIIINDTALDFYYNPTWLSLVKGMNKKTLSVDCLNLHPSIRNSYPHQINITNNILNTNFSTGQVYIQYSALPTDEDGEILIPELTTGDIRDYLTKYVKVQIAEDLIANNRNPQGIAQLFPLWKQELLPLKTAALKESKFYGLGKDYQKKIQVSNKQYISIFTLPSLSYR